MVVSVVAADALAAVRAVIDRAPALRGVLGAILDAREGRGRLPGRLTVDADDSAAAALAELLSARAVKRVAGDRVRVDLARADQVCRDQLGVGLDALLYGALDREPRDPAAEEAALRADLARGLAGVDATSDAACRFVAAEAAAAAAGSGDSLGMAREVGVAAAVAEVSLMSRCIDAALVIAEPLRQANFAARVLGDSKALARGDRLRRLGSALLAHHEPTFEAVHVGSGELSERHARALALEVNGIYRDEAALTVHCFGPLVYRKGSQRFDHVARHAALGEPVPLSLAQLRGAAVDDLPVERALVIENQTPFLDYVDAGGGGGRELVVFSGGHASWAVVQLLRMVGRAGIPVAHSGDLDRSGVLIVRSLQARLFTRVDPVAMDVATHARFAERGRALTAAERARLRDLVARDDPSAVGADLLRAILDGGVWIEQERFFAEALGIGGHRAHS